MLSYTIWRITINIFIKLSGNGTGFLFNQLQGVLADIAAMVGNTLHVAHQLQTAGNLAPVGCYPESVSALAPGIAFDIDLAVVKIIVIADNLLR